MKQKTSPKVYRARFIEPGVISYEDVGQGRVYVSREFLDKMRPTFIGMPVFNLIHKEVEADQAFDLKEEDKDNLADGIITDVYTADDGWDWAKMLVWDKDTQDNIDKNGFSCSCAYDILRTIEGGSRNGIDYDAEPTDGKYVHMAIVEEPRYSESTVVQNSKGGEAVKKGFWIWKAKNAEPTEEEKKAAADKAAADAESKKNASEAGEGADGADQFVMIEGKKVALKDLVDAYQGTAENDGAGEAGLGDDEQVQLANGEMCSVGDLKRAYMSRKNDTTAGPTAGADDVEKDLETARASNAKGAKGTKADPNGHFVKVKNAAEREAESLAPAIETRADRLKNGSSRYGSVVKNDKGAA